MPEPSWRTRLDEQRDALARWFRDSDAERLWAAYAVHWWWTVPVTLVVLLVGLVTSLFLLDYARTDVPAVGDAAIAPPTVLTDAHGEPIGKLDPGVVGEQVDSTKLPDHVLQAVFAAEDRRFWDHGGFSLPATVRAALANLRGGGIEQGASTITQQYVDLTTPGGGRSYREKLREIAAAMKYEDELGKREILDRYLNVVPFGRDTRGVDAASRVYFGVAATELDLNQAATLAGIIAAPSAYDPEGSPEAATRRRDFVLAGMGEMGWLTRQEVSRAQSQPLPEIVGQRAGERGAEAYFVDAVRRELEHVLPDQDLSRGYVVHTTLDPVMQEHTQAVVRNHVAEAPYTGAAVIVDPASGAVRALVGGADFATESFNAAVQARRQPGSSFKPFTLAAFIEAGFSPDRSEFPAPEAIKVAVPGEDVTVENFEGQSFGRLDVRSATEMSVNTVYMQMIAEVQPERVADLAVAMGAEGEVPAVPSLALGTASISPLHMANAYATLASGGVRHDPHLVTRVTDAEGDVVYEVSGEAQRVISEQTAGLVTDVLSGVVAEGTGQAAQIGRPVAGKTGTTDDGRDAWFVGYTPHLAAAVWVGMADNTPMGDATGGELAAPIWAEIMAQVHAGLPAEELTTAGDDGLDEIDVRSLPEEAKPDENDRDDE